MLTLVIILSLLTIIFFLIILCFLEFKYIRFIMNRYLFTIENIEKIRDSFITYEDSFYMMTRNPMIQMEVDYKRVAATANEIKSIMAEFEEFYQNLPEKKEISNEK